MSNYKRTADWLAACGKKPIAEDLSVQIGCHFEEFLEFLSTLSFDGVGQISPANLVASSENFARFANDIKSGVIKASIRDRVACLDALCDTEVTGNGVAFLACFDKEGADQAVLDANDAKLVDGKPVILEGGKIGKPEGWTAPDLKAFV
jgi:predicted HAD superfamily Cof-like phosphohydrolase